MNNIEFIELNKMMDVKKYIHVISHNVKMDEELKNKCELFFNSYSSRITINVNLKPKSYSALGKNLVKDLSSYVVTVKFNDKPFFNFGLTLNDRQIRNNTLTLSLIKLIYENQSKIYK